MTQFRVRAARTTVDAARACAIAALAIALAWTSAGAVAAPAAPTERSASAYVRAWLPEARMVGSGRLTWFGLHAYDAALFAPQGRFAADRPFALELTYARDFKGEAIAERSISEIRKLGKLSEPDAAPWSALLRELFPDVRRGDRLTGIAGVDGAARFYLNGRAIGTLADERLARAFFAIWLDSRTSAPGLRKQLLGLAGPAS
ncbi:MAG: chalcone isomerase family protein [Burkholderiales bacterium]|nr:chalcone isomerase family protein [Burkholderiales bacterium]